MKTVFLILAGLIQFAFFYLVFLGGTFAGALFDPLHLRWFVSHPTPFSTRYFTPDGLLLLIAVYLLLLAAEAIFKARRPHRAITTAAFVLALLFGFVSKIGFITS
jgi:hypothetical protein